MILHRMPRFITAYYIVYTNAAHNYDALIWFVLLRLNFARWFRLPTTTVSITQVNLCKTGFKQYNILCERCYISHCNWSYSLTIWTDNAWWSNFEVLLFYCQTFMLYSHNILSLWKCMDNIFIANDYTYNNFPFRAHGKTSKRHTRGLFCKTSN